MLVIYALVDSMAPWLIRYVGKTAQRPSDRLAKHLRDARRGGMTHRANWIRAVLLNDHAVEQFILAFADDNSHANKLEQMFIARFREIGLPLTNLTEGGDGIPKGYVFSAQARENMRRSNWLRGKKRSPESVAASARGRRGQPLSAEAKAKISAAKKGVPHIWTPEAREKVRAALLGKPKPYMAARNKAFVWTPESRARLSASQLARQARTRGEVIPQ